MKLAGIAPLVWWVRQRCLCVNSSKQSISVGHKQPHIYITIDLYTCRDNSESAGQITQEQSDGRWRESVRVRLIGLCSTCSATPEGTGLDRDSI